VIVKRRAVAKYLKRARLEAGFSTQAAFAKATGLSQQQISNYEKLGRIPQENIAGIARALKKPVTELAMLLVEAADEDERETRRERDTLVDRLTRFADKYEELGHTYSNLDVEVRAMRADYQNMIKRLDNHLARMEERLLAVERLLSDS
jgi:transcriptional regulator with XRE-family HTH domain